MYSFIKNKKLSLKNATFVSLNHQKTNKMLQEITIKNFKSIENDTIQLGRVNVFIGENGCGKSNILEAVAFLSAGWERRMEGENLISKGVRIAKSELTISNFKNKKQVSSFNIYAKLTHSRIKEYNCEFKNSYNEYVDKFWNIVISLVKINENETERVDFNALTTLFVEKFHVKQDKEVSPYDDFIMMLDSFAQRGANRPTITDFLIYALNTPALRGFTNESRKEPVGIYGENLDYLIANFDKDELQTLKKYNYLIEWLADFDIDREDNMKFNGYKPNRSKSKLFFKDKFMATKNNLFSAENANEGILHILFYLSVMISKRTPKFFAIDNIESCLNPHLCTNLMKGICTLAKDQDKQLLITTHNPAILDGLNLNDDEIRLFEVSRNPAGHTVTRRITVKPEHEQQEGRRLKLSELWTRGYLGAISEKY
jgi:AAA15 family ATPase/GTPase